MVDGLVCAVKVVKKYVGEEYWGIKVLEYLGTVFLVESSYIGLNV
jgi:hypothetical protein